MIAEKLKELAEAHPACRLTVYADLSVPMALLSQAATPAPRERLQALCSEGADVLRAVDGGEPPDPDTLSDTAIAARGGDLAVFLRHPAAPDEALCCLCETTLDMAAFLPDARACLEAIAGGAE